MSWYTFYEFARLQGFDDIDAYLDIPAWEEWPKPSESVERGYADEEHREEALRKIMQGRQPIPPRMAYLYKLPSEYTPKPNPKEDNWYMVEFEGTWGSDYRDCIYFYDRHYQAREELAELEGDLYPVTIKEVRSMKSQLIKDAIKAYRNEKEKEL